MKPRMQGRAVRLSLAAALALYGGAVLAQAGTAPAATASPAPAAVPNDAPPPAPNSADQADPENEQKIKLPNVNVEGKRNVFTDSDKKLKQLQDSLPCAGCDAKPHTKRKFVKRVLDAVGDRVLPTEAPDHSTLDANDKAEDFAKHNLCGPGNISGCVPDNVKP